MRISLVQLAVYISYLFVTVAYAIKVVKFARLPVHLRWELYPVIPESRYRYGGSYYEDVEWWTKPHRKNMVRAVLYLLGRYLFFGEYFRRNKSYWTGLYLWHTGFYLIFTFHMLTFLTALGMTVFGWSVASGAPGIGGALYYVSLLFSLVGFSLGTLGSLILLAKRSFDRALKDYASPMNYANYLFFLVVFVSGFIAYFADPTYSEYREFWRSLITFRYMTMPAAAVYSHVLLFSLFLLYLPFTRSTHYILKLFGYFGIRWDDSPNLDGAVSSKVGKWLGKPVTWSAPHIQTGGTWGEVVQKLPEMNVKQQGRNEQSQNK